MKKMMNELRIGNLRVKLPIVQGGMGVGVSLSGLASAVANEGGVGIISAVGIGMNEPNYRKNFKASNKIALRKEIRKARSKTNGIIGVNLMLAITDFENLLEVALDEKVDVVIIGAGLPIKKPETIDIDLLENGITKFIPKVSSARAAKIIFQQWSEKYNRVPDAVIVEGPLAGGHLGFKMKEVNEPTISLSSIIEEIIPIIKIYELKFAKEIPVIAGGGIYTGQDVYDIMALGAKGVKMGTRFVTTKECDVSDKFKQVYLSSASRDITTIQSPVGLPGRVISNEFVKQIQAGNQKPVNCPWKCLKTCDYKKVQFCIADALFNAAKGNFSGGFAFAGTNAYRAEEIITVRETIDQIKEEFFQEELHAEADKLFRCCG
jgi:nitronate monooxygenase